MSYNVKYRFRFWSEHGVLHTVTISQDGYSGDAIERTLGKSPVVRMQENGAFRSTSCDLVLECQEDGEFADLYTSNPREFMVGVYRGGSLSAGGELVWKGFVATELYSEPDIAPPYDVAVTATDGLGVLKEYDFEGRGLRKVHEMLSYLLGKTGLSQSVYCLTSEGPTSGTPVTMFDSVSIDMDYMVGKNCYEVLDELLRSLHFTVTQYRGEWLLVRETDLADNVTSAGGLSVYLLPIRSVTTTTTATLANARKTVGKMGVADVWPIGHLTRRVVPAKRELVIEAPWHPVNVAPEVCSNDWSQNGPVSPNYNPDYYTLGGKVNTVWTDGEIGATIPFDSFQVDLTVRVRYNRSNGQWGVRPTANRRIRLRAIWEVAGVMYHYNIDDGWTESSGLVYVDTIDVDHYAGNSNHDPALAAQLDFSIPAYGGTASGYLTIVVCGLGVDVYDVELDVALSKGYKDTLILGNGARGKDSPRTITGGRALSGYLNATALYAGLFVWSSNPETAVYDWADNRRYGLNFVSLTALDYALSVAAPRVELSGKIDFPAALTYIPLVLSLRSILYQLKTYEWTLLNDEVSFVAVSTPAATVNVESETVISIPNDQ